MTAIDLNVDLGEGADDEPLLRLVTSINVACGAHAGDAETMTALVDHAKRFGLALGAHPGYADRDGFGRRELSLGEHEIERLVTTQLDRLAAIAVARGAKLAHVKPHGALYNQAALDRALAAAIARAVFRFDRRLRLVGLGGSALVTEAVGAGLAVANEAFADRRYRSDGTLAPRSHGLALIDEPAEAALQALAIARGEPVATIDGGSITIRAETICLHGDSPGAVNRATAVRAALDRGGIEVRALGLA